MKNNQLDNLLKKLKQDIPKELDQKVYESIELKFSKKQSFIAKLFQTSLPIALVASLVIFIVKTSKLPEIDFLQNETQIAQNYEFIGELDTLIAISDYEIEIEDIRDLIDEES